MHAAHHPIFVVLSILTAWFGSWTALDLFRRVRAHEGAWRMAWIAAAGVAMGLSIWSMHFIAMLGFDPGTEVRYDVRLTLLSLGLAIAATTFAFFFYARQQGFDRQLLSGLIMGAGICTMHYVGMSAANMVCIAASPSRSMAVGGSDLVLSVFAMVGIVLILIYWVMTDVDQRARPAMAAAH